MNRSRRSARLSVDAVFAGCNLCVCKGTHGTGVYGSFCMASLEGLELAVSPEPSPTGRRSWLGPGIPFPHEHIWQKKGLGTLPVLGAGDLLLGQARSAG